MSRLFKSKLMALTITPQTLKPLAYSTTKNNIFPPAMHRKVATGTFADVPDKTFFILN